MQHRDDDAERSYNRVYERLVHSDDDLVGMIAYALYKQTKRNWLLATEQERGTRPSRDDESTFVRTQLLPENLQRLRSEAEGLLGAYSDYIVDQKAPAIREDAIGQNFVSQASHTLNRLHGQNAWWRQLILAALGALAYTALLLVIAVVLRWAGVDLVAVTTNVTG